MKYNLSISMTRGEKIAGFIYLPFFYVITSIIVVFVMDFLGFGDDLALVNLVYSYVNFGFIVIAFHKFLAGSLFSFGKNFWKSVQAIVLSVALYYALTIVLSLALTLFGDFSNPNDDLVSDVAGMSSGIVIICACILAPIVEEVLFRGVVFGVIRRKNRITAYVVSSLLFGAVHVWQFVILDPSWTLILNFVQYLPASIALAWAYEKGDNIFCPIVLHALINVLGVSAMLVLF